MRKPPDNAPTTITALLHGELGAAFDAQLAAGADITDLRDDLLRRIARLRRPVPPDED